MSGRTGPFWNCIRRRDRPARRCACCRGPRCIFLTYMPLEKLIPFDSRLQARTPEEAFSEPRAMPVVFFSSQLDKKRSVSKNQTHPSLCPYFSLRRDDKISSISGRKGGRTGIGAVAPAPIVRKFNAVWLGKARPDGRLRLWIQVLNLRILKRPACRPRQTARRCWPLRPAGRTSFRSPANPE